MTNELIFIILTCSKNRTLILWAVSAVVAEIPSAVDPTAANALANFGALS